jgi:hypothetical protein
MLDMPDLQNQLREAVRRDGRSSVALSALLSMHVVSFRQWLRGTTGLSRERCERLADLLGCSIQVRCKPAKCRHQPPPTDTREAIHARLQRQANAHALRHNATGVDNANRLA